MLHLSYDQIYSLIDAIDEYIGDCFTRRKFCGLLGDISHFRRLRKEYKEGPVVALMAIVALRYQKEDLLIDICPRITVRINRGASLESILATIKSSISWQNRRWRQ